MSFKKRTSSAYGAAIKRMASLVSIEPTLDLGNGLTVQNYQSKIDEVKAFTDSYNTKLSEVDSKLASLKDKEKALKNLSERMLLAVAVKFGKDSYEYQMAGGTRKSTYRKRGSTDKGTKAS